MPMAEPAVAPPTVLGSVKVVDWTDQSGAYAGRLLADLGADVVRVETCHQDGPWPEEAMAAGLDGPATSALERFVNLNKRSVRLDTRSAAGRQVLEELLGHADVVITSGEAAERWHADGNEFAPAGVHVSVSPFGQSGDGAALAADDLVTLAAGGLLSLGGYPDSEPVAVYGQQT
jgi:benzylsuccinate CoA-transferase BbsE subunit